MNLFLYRFDQFADDIHHLVCIRMLTILWLKFEQFIYTPKACKDHHLIDETYLLTILLSFLFISRPNGFWMVSSDLLQLKLNCSWIQDIFKKSQKPEEKRSWGKKWIGSYALAVMMEKSHAASMLQYGVQVHFFYALRMKNKISDNIAVIHLNSHVVNFAGVFSAIHVSIALNSRFT